MDKDLEILFHTKSKSYEFDLVKRKIDCPATIDVNGKTVEVQGGWQYILRLRHFEMNIDRKSAFFISDDEDKGIGKDEYANLLLEHVSFLFFHILKRDISNLKTQ